MPTGPSRCPRCRRRLEEDDSLIDPFFLDGLEPRGAVCVSCYRKRRAAWRIRRCEEATIRHAIRATRKGWSPSSD